VALGVASLEGDKILVKSGLIRWVTFSWRGLIRGVS
jgi:hypothetical protein